MRDVFSKVIVVVLAMLVLVAPAAGAEQTVAKKTGPLSDFDKLDNSLLLRTITRYDMKELRRFIVSDDPLEAAKLAADSMRRLAAPAVHLKKGKEIIATLEVALDKAEQDMAAAQAAANKVAGKARTMALIKAATATKRYFEMWYFLGDLAGRRVIEPYTRKMIYLQDNREDRKAVLEMTEFAVQDLQDIQTDLKEAMQAWKDDMAVWMVMGGQGEQLLRDIRYWSTSSYMNRAMALGDAETYESERQDLTAAFKRLSAHIPKGQTAALQKLKDRLAADLAKAKASQARRTAQKKELLQKILRVLPEFESTTRFGVTHDARVMLAAASREMGDYSGAINNLAPPRYKGANPGTKIRAAMELPITLVKQGQYSEAGKAITAFQTLAEKVIGKGAKIPERTQAQIDLQTAMLKEYLARRQAANSSGAAKTRHIAEGQAALVDFLDKYKDEGIKQAFINFFGNRLLYTEEIESLSSVQLYIIARGAAAGAEPEKRRAMLETILDRKDDPSARKLLPAVHWQLALTLNKLGRQMDSADHFISVTKMLDASNPRAQLAAENAAICMAKYAEWYRANHKKGLTRQVREKYVEAMMHAVSFDTEEPNPKLATWYYPLGVQCDELSQVSTKDEAAKWMKKASDAYVKVPEKPVGRFINARDLWLSLRYRALGKVTKIDARTAADAGKLRSDYETFVQSIKERVAKLPAGDELIEEWNLIAAWCDFIRARLLAEQMQKETLALVEVESVLKKWAKVDDVVVAATQWKIQNLINLGKIEKASAEIQAFKNANEQRPDVWRNLISEVVDGIRKAIDKEQGEKGDKGRLAALRKSFLQLAEIEYSQIKGKPIQDANGKVNESRLSITQLWIDALVQNDKGPDAMKLAAECKRIFDARRDAAKKAIDAKYGPVIGKCKEAVGFYTQMEKLVLQFYAELTAREKEGLGDFDAKEDARAVRGAFKTVQDARKAKASAEYQKRLMGSLSLELRTGYREIVYRLKRRIPVSLPVEWNVAKCLAATGEYSKALEIYVKLIQGSDPSGSKAMKRLHWRLQLEYCQTFMKALSSDKVQMGKLLNYIDKELPKTGGDELGGFKVQFFEIKEKARLLSK